MPDLGSMPSEELRTRASGETLFVQREQAERD